MPKAARRTGGAKPAKGAAPYPASKQVDATNHGTKTTKHHAAGHHQQSQREPLTTLANIPAPSAATTKHKTSHSNSTNTNNSSNPSSFLAVVLPGEDKHAVPVHDSCDELRAKIRAFLDAKPPVPGQTDKKGNPKLYTRTQLVKDLGVNTNTLRRFMEREGEMAGAELGAYYQAYCFFEKLRIFNGQEKSPSRLESEKKNPTGRPLKDPTHRRPVWVLVKKGENPNDFLTNEEVAQGWHFPDFPSLGERLATGELTLADIDRMEADQKKNGGLGLAKGK